METIFRPDAREPAVIERTLSETQAQRGGKPVKRPHSAENEESVASLEGGGENIAPLEIEERLISHPGVGLCRVIGNPDQRYAEHIASFMEFSGQGHVLRDE